MSAYSRTLIAGIFDQLRVLRQAVTELGAVEESDVASLRGSQTMDVEGAIHLSFMKLQDQIAAMEETLATIAEATGEIPKL